MDNQGLFRLLPVLILVITIAISGFYRKRARAGGDVIPRNAESLGLRLLRVALTLPYLIAFLAYLIDPRWMAWSALPLPIGIRWLGVTLGLINIPMVVWIMRNLGTNVSETVLTKRHHELVTSGPYRWVRHPLYSSSLLLLLALGLIAANGFLLALVPVLLIAILAVIVPREEAELTRTFGDRYSDYRRQTGAVLPRIGVSATTIDSA